MIIRKEYTFDEVFHDFTLFETLEMLNLLYDAKINLLEMLSLLEDKSYDAYIFEIEKDLDLIDKNINTFQVAVMAHESKIFDKVTLCGVKVLIANN